MGQGAIEDDHGEGEMVGFHLRNSEAFKGLEDQLGYLPVEGKRAFSDLMGFSPLFQDASGRTALARCSPLAFTVAGPHCL